MKTTVPEHAAKMEDARQVEQERKNAALEREDERLINLTIAEFYREVSSRKDAMTETQLRTAVSIIDIVDEQVRRASSLLLKIEGDNAI